MAMGLALVLFLVGGALAACGQTTDLASSHRSDPPRRSAHQAPTTVPPTTSTLPSAVPTTVPAPVVAAPGWATPLTALPPGGGFTSVSCLSDTFCIAAGGGDNQADTDDTGGAGVTDSWDGAAWADPSVYFPAPASGSTRAPIMPALSCTGGPTCVIVDGTDHVSTGDGTHWSAPVAVPPGPPAPAEPSDPGPGHPGSRHAAVDCPAPSFCAAVDSTGDAAVLQDGRWSPLGRLPGGVPPGSLYVAGPVGLSCPDASNCLAVIGADTFGWSGSSWTPEAPWTSAGAGAGGAALSCSSVDRCWVVGGHQAAEWTSGVWSPPTTVDAGGQLDAVSCPTSSFCVAVDAGGSVVSWDGTAWSAPHHVLPGAVTYTGDPTSVSCPSAQFCMVLDGDGDYTTYTGTPSSAAPGSPPAST